MGTITKGGKTSRRSKKPWYKKRYNVMEIAGKALSGVKYLKGLVNAEKKFHGTAVIQGVDSTGVVLHLTDIGQGTANNQRNGRSLLARGLLVRGELRMNPSVQSSTVRLVVFRDNNDIDNISNAPIASDYLEGVATSLAPFQPYNDDNLKRFTTLFSKMYTLSNTGTNTLPVKFFLKMQKHIKYSGASTADVGVGQLYIMAISTEPGVSEPALNIISRFYYYDN